MVTHEGPESGVTRGAAPARRLGQPHRAAAGDAASGVAGSGGACPRRGTPARPPRASADAAAPRGRSSARGSGARPIRWHTTSTPHSGKSEHVGRARDAVGHRLALRESPRRSTIRRGIPRRLSAHTTISPGFGSGQRRRKLGRAPVLARDLDHLFGGGACRRPRRSCARRRGRRGTRSVAAANATAFPSIGPPGRFRAAHSLRAVNCG